MVLLNRVFVVDTGDQTLVGNVQKGHTRGFVDAAALGFDDAVFDLIAHAQAVTTANAVGFHHQFDRIGKFFAIESNRLAFFEANAHGFGRNLNVFVPESDAHDRFNDLHGSAEAFQILGFVRGAEHVGVSGISLFSLHAIFETFGVQEGRHFRATAEFGNELGIEPRLVDLEIGVDQQTITVKTFDVVALVGRAVAPDVHTVFAHGSHKHRAGHGTTNRRRVEVGLTGGCDMEGARLDGGNAFGHELRTTVNQTSGFCAVLHGATRDGFVVVLVRLTEISRVCVRECTLVLHPAQCGAGIKAARECDADFLADGNALQNRLRHCSLFKTKISAGHKPHFRRTEFFASGRLPLRRDLPASTANYGLRKLPLSLDKATNQPKNLKKSSRSVALSFGTDSSGTDFAQSAHQFLSLYLCSFHQKRNVSGEISFKNRPLTAPDHGNCVLIETMLHFNKNSSRFNTLGYG